MKKIFLIPILMTVTFYCYSQSALRLQGIIDFDLTSGGYTGKAVHLFVGTSINDLSQYGIGVANNGNGGDGQEYTFPTISVDDGDHILLARDSSALSSYLGVCYQMFDVIIIASNAIDQNGNDAIELYKDSVVVQTFGDIVLMELELLGNISILGHTEQDHLVHHLIFLFGHLAVLNVQ